MYEFLIKEKPSGSQLIFTAEEPDITSDEEYEIIHVGVKKDRLMDEFTYDRIFGDMKPYLDAFI